MEPHRRNGTNAFPGASYVKSFLSWCECRTSCRTEPLHARAAWSFPEAYTKDGTPKSFFRFFFRTRVRSSQARVLQGIPGPTWSGGH